MVCCVSSNIRTKRELRERANVEPRNIRLDDPSIVQWRSFTLDQMVVGQEEFVTNHPKRSWFAHIIRTSNGFTVK